LAAIAFDIALQLPRPVVCVCGWLAVTALALVLVPEATMNEDDFAEAWKHKVGRSRQVGPVKAVSESHAVNQSAHLHFRCSIFGPNARHRLAALAA
jgi:hypothetical protein